MLTTLKYFCVCKISVVEKAELVKGKETFKYITKKEIIIVVK